MLCIHQSEASTSPPPTTRHINFWSLAYSNSPSKSPQTMLTWPAHVFISVTVSAASMRSRYLSLKNEKRGLWWAFHKKDYIPNDLESTHVTMMVWQKEFVQDDDIHTLFRTHKWDIVKRVWIFFTCKKFKLPFEINLDFKMGKNCSLKSRLTSKYARNPIFYWLNNIEFCKC